MFQLKSFTDHFKMIPILFERKKRLSWALLFAFYSGMTFSFALLVFHHFRGYIDVNVDFMLMRMHRYHLSLHLNSACYCTSVLFSSV